MSYRLLSFEKHQQFYQSRNVLDGNNFKLPTGLFDEKLPLDIINADLLNASENFNTYRKIEECLLEGANPNVKDPLGETPLHKAARIGNEAVINLLLSHGSNIEAVTFDGRSPLSNALKYEKITSVKTLLENGAKLTAQSFLTSRAVVENKPLNRSLSCDFNSNKSIVHMHNTHISHGNNSLKKLIRIPGLKAINTLLKAGVEKRFLSNEIRENFNFYSRQFVIQPELQDYYAKLQSILDESIAQNSQREHEPLHGPHEYYCFNQHQKAKFCYKKTYIKTGN